MSSASQIETVRPVRLSLAPMMSILGWLTKVMTEGDQAEPDAVAIDAAELHDRVLVIDSSPSMEATDWKPSRLKAAIGAAKAFIKRLAECQPSARVALVTYDRTATILCPPISADQKRTLHTALGRIRVGSSTNIHAGLNAALTLMMECVVPAQVVLLSDGHHNFGPDPRNISGKLKQHAVIECVGIGGSPECVEENLMKDIASLYPDGSPRYHWIGNERDLSEHYRRLAGRLRRSP